MAFLFPLKLPPATLRELNYDKFLKNLIFARLSIYFLKYCHHLLTLADFFSGNFHFHKTGLPEKLNLRNDTEIQDLLYKDR